jgi:hypothetical protein
MRSVLLSTLRVLAVVLCAAGAATAKQTVHKVEGKESWPSRPTKYQAKLQAGMPSLHGEQAAEWGQRFGGRVVKIEEHSVSYRSKRKMDYAAKVKRTYYYATKTFRIVVEHGIHGADFAADTLNSIVGRSTLATARALLASLRSKGPTAGLHHKLSSVLSGTRVARFATQVKQAEAAVERAEALLQKRNTMSEDTFVEAVAKATTDLEDAFADTEASRAEINRLLHAYEANGKPARPVVKPDTYAERRARWKSGRNEREARLKEAESQLAAYLGKTLGPKPSPPPPSLATGRDTYAVSPHGVHFSRESYDRYLTGLEDKLERYKRLPRTTPAQLARIRQEIRDARGWRKAGNAAGNKQRQQAYQRQLQAWESRRERLLKTDRHYRDLLKKRHQVRTDSIALYPTKPGGDWDKSIKLTGVSVSRTSRTATIGGKTYKPGDTFSTFLSVGHRGHFRPFNGIKLEMVYEGFIICSYYDQTMMIPVAPSN